ncbi:hypothetical protein, partial [Pseudomonas viridiflava]|uniref:hypothetical protein n=1 Tax=Pseudomonas viridiflava TaxID=33069 RepID=UPI001F14A435
FYLLDNYTVLDDRLKLEFGAKNTLTTSTAKDKGNGYARGSLLSLHFQQAATTQNWTVETFTPFLTLYLDSLKKLLATEGNPITLDSVDSRLPGHYLDAVAQNII